MQTSTIFLVDDDPLYQYMIRRYVHEYALASNFVTFNNGLLAIEKLKELAASESPMPDVILLDINMPVLDGWGFLAVFQADEKLKELKIPIYLVTSSVDERDVEKAKCYNMVLDYCIKPLSVQQLQTLLSKNIA